MWVGIPVTMLVASGIIMNLPQEQIEAAEIDGANKFQIFKSITFPQNFTCDDAKLDSTIYR